MAHSYRRPYQLARASGLPVSEVLARIRAAGASITGEGGLVPKDLLPSLYVSLGIDPATGRRRDDTSTSRRKSPPGAPVVAVLDASTETEKKKRRPAGPKANKKPGLPPVGHPVESMDYLTAKDVEKIHLCLVDDFARARDPIDPPGVKSWDMLESA